MAEQQINKAHGWRLAINLDNAEDIIVSATSNDDAVAKAKEIIDQGYLAVVGVRGQLDFTRIYPLHRIRDIEIYEDDTLFTPTPLRRPFDPKLIKPRVK